VPLALSFWRSSGHHQRVRRLACRRLWQVTPLKRRGHGASSSRVRPALLTARSRPIASCKHSPRPRLGCCLLLFEVLESVHSNRATVWGVGNCVFGRRSSSSCQRPSRRLMSSRKRGAESPPLKLASAHWPGLRRAALPALPPPGQRWPEVASWRSKKICPASSAGARRHLARAGP